MGRFIRHLMSFLLFTQIICCVTAIFILLFNFNSHQSIYLSTAEFIRSTIFLISLHNFLTIIAFWASLVNQEWLLTMYLVPAVFVLTLELVAVHLEFTSLEKDKFLQKFDVNQYLGFLYDQFTFQLDLIQAEYKCCGMVSYTEFDHATKWERYKTQKIPFSCCPRKSKALTHDAANLVYKACPYKPTLMNSYIGQPCLEMMFDSVYNIDIKIISVYAIQIAYQVSISLSLAVYLIYSKYTRSKSPHSYRLTLDNPSHFDFRTAYGDHSPNQRAPGYSRS